MAQMTFNRGSVVSSVLQHLTTRTSTPALVRVGLTAAVAAAAPIAQTLPRNAAAKKHTRGGSKLTAPAHMNTSNAGTGVALSQYLGRGPYTSSQLPQMTIRVGQGTSGPLDCTFSMFTPQSLQQAPQRWPLVVLSAGFLLHSGLYGSYAADLASWGLAVVLYDVPELVDDVHMVGAIGSIMDSCTRDPRVSPFVDPGAILLAGHSRGGKLSVLAAASDPRVKGIALLDPVDVTGMTPMGPGYPSALPAMRVACSPPRRVPALVVGAARNTDIIPADANYRRFITSCPGPCWSLELLGAGHLQFLDTQVDIFSAFVGSGPTPDDVVRRSSKAAILAWALELAVPLARGEAVDVTQVMERLQQTAAAMERQAPLSSSLRGFENLGGAAAGGTGAAGSSSRSSDAYGGGAASAARPESAADASSSRAGSSTSSSATGGGAGTRSRAAPGTWSYEALLKMRARELKAILVEADVDCSDCFEKEDLARRILETC